MKILPKSILLSCVATSSLFCLNASASSHNLMVKSNYSGYASISVSGYSGCKNVPEGRWVNTGFSVKSGAKLRIYIYGGANCFSAEDSIQTVTVPSNLSTKNFWLTLD